MHSKITRRDFLKLSSLSAASLLAACTPAAGSEPTATAAPTPTASPVPTALPPTPQPAATAAPTPTPALVGVDQSYDYTACHQLAQTAPPAASAALPGRVDCAIVGGGMSGLVAAWKLSRLGVEDFLVIEKEAQMGGLCAADEINGITAAKASAYPSFPFNQDMLDLYRDLGFISGKGRKITVDPRYILPPPYDRLFMDGQWIDDPFGAGGLKDLPVPKQVRRDLQALIDRLEELWEWEDDDGRAAFDCPVDAASPVMRSLDAMTLKEYGQAQGWDVALLRLFDPLLRSAYGLGHERISAWAALDLLSDELLPADAGESSLGFAGGNAYFAAALAQKLGAERLVNNALVTAIRQQGDEVQVTFVQNGQPQTLLARSLVFAAPQFMAPFLLPGLPDAKVQAARRFEYATYLVANLAVVHTPAGLAYSNQLAGDFLLSDFIVADWVTHSDPQSAPLDRPNVLTAYCPLEAGDRTRLLTPDTGAWQKKLLAELEQCLPGVSQTVTGYSQYRWGHAFAVPASGAVFAPHRQAARQVWGRISFAHADVEGIPTIDHAMASGFRSAQEVRAMLG